MTRCCSCLCVACRSVTKPWCSTKAHMSGPDSWAGVYDVMLGETRFVLVCCYQHDTFGWTVSPMVRRERGAQGLKEGNSFLMWLGDDPERLLELACRYLASYCGPQTSERVRGVEPLTRLPEAIEMRTLERDERNERTRLSRRRRTRTRQVDEGDAGTADVCERPMSKERPRAPQKRSSAKGRHPRAPALKDRTREKASAGRAVGR